MKLDEKMQNIIRDAVLYLIFLAIVLVSICLMSDPDIYNQNAELIKLFNITSINVLSQVNMIYG